MRSDVLPLRSIVESGLCIGCGLCVPIGGPENVQMRLTSSGVERPAERTPVSGDALRLINQVCPGLHVQQRVDVEPAPHPLWGPVRRIATGHATDPEVRFLAATGGVLTALGQFLLTSGRVDRILHVGASSDPVRHEAKISTTPQQVLERSGSVYGPAAPLVRLYEALEEPGQVAVIAKPCDIAAVRSVLRSDPTLEASVACLLTISCGGASKLTKTWGLLDDFGVAYDDVAELSYRGSGNPGPTRVRTRSGEVHETTYQQLWENEGTWDLQWRCKVCADGVGETADLVSLDCWPGGGPTGEDAGFNGIIARTEVGAELLSAAVEAGAVTITEDELDIEVLELWQPHQSRRKLATPGRLAAMADAGLPTVDFVGFGLEALPGEVDEGTAVRIAERRHADDQPAW